MKRFLVLLVALVVVIGLVTFPAYAQQAGLSLEQLAGRIDVLFAGQTYLTQRIVALETAVALSAQSQVVVSTTTPIPLPTHTFTPTPTLTPEPTETATRKPSATPTLTATPPAEAQLRVEIRAQLRRGPGTNHAVVGTAEAGSILTITGRNLNRTWWQVDYEGNPAWIQYHYVTTAYSHLVKVVATPTPLPSPTVKATITMVPTATMESMGEEIWDRLMEAARADIAGVKDDENNFDLEDAITKYYDVLADLEPHCELTKIEIIDLVDPHAQRIDDSGISEKTGYWARWSLLSGMKNYLSQNEADCSEYIKDYAAWVIVKYGGDE